MLSFPNCKINLGLNILRKRADGFHDLETIFYPVNFNDCLELVPGSAGSTPFSFHSSGLEIPGDAEDNLCSRAYWLLKKDFPELPAVKVHLHKVIPMGAGLGGGSSDGAFMLKMLNEKFSLRLPAEKMIAYAQQLGSDGPFFVINKPCFATGRGEILEPVDIDLSAYDIVLVNPGIHINTTWAFGQLMPSIPAKKISDIVAQPIAQWKHELKNDFETAVFAHHPAIKTIKDQLYHAGALYSAMSGSGSTVFGIFNAGSNPEPDLPANYFVKTIPA